MPNFPSVTFIIFRVYFLLVLLSLFYESYSNIFWILFEYFLNLIRIFSESYSYMMNMQNMCDIHYLVIYIFEYYLYIFEILFVYIENATHVSYSLFSYIYFWILSIYFWNLIRICWKCKTCVIVIIQHFWILSEFYSNIFWILFVYAEHAKHVWYSLFKYIHFWILSVYFRNLIRIYWKCKIV